MTATSSRPGLEGETGAGLGDVAELCGRIATNVQRVIVGKPEVVRVALVALLAEGHLLVEDVPGVGKTSLAKALARSIDCSVSRVQFTPDLLPGDITGLSVFNRQTAEFEFRPGPVFANIVIADEINRASPKTQSALLECMAEHQVTVDGATYALASPFMVVATQNPVEMEGTYPLPEAQLDRFLMRISVGHPDAAATEELLLDSGLRDRASLVKPIATTDHIGQMVSLAREVHVDRAIVKYVRELADASRADARLSLGLSARGCLALVRVAKTWAAASGRGAVVPDDVQVLAKPVLNHRLLLEAQAQFSGVTVDQVIDELLRQVPPPTTRG